MKATLISLVAVALSGFAWAQQSVNDRMAEEHVTDTPVASALTTLEPARPVTGATVTYATVDGKPAEGYLARPSEGEGPWPGIIVIHEWWGLNDNIRATTRRLAGEGYAALAVDLYGGKSAETAEEARGLVQAALENTRANDANLEQAYEYLTTKERCPKVGVIGWCFGGGFSLQTALLMPDKINACVIYYGHLETAEAKLRPLQMPILGIFGSEDQSIPVEQVRAFQQTLEKLGKHVEIHVYEGAHHAFANPSGTRYDATAAADAWEKTIAFFTANLK
jgi:carboxymethylenebutenolidase